MDFSLPTEQEDAALADDLLRGGRAIALFLFGSDSDAARKKVYHLAQYSRLPTFKLGGLLCARRTVLRAWIAAQEKCGMKGIAWSARHEQHGGHPTSPDHTQAAEQALTACLERARAILASGSILRADLAKYGWNRLCDLANGLD
jgi:hypothetical protein